MKCVDLLYFRVIGAVARLWRYVWQWNK